MKNRWFLGLGILLIFGLLLVGCNFQTDEELDNLLGEWEGSYGANQGESAVTLTVYTEGSSYKAIWDSYNLPGRTNNSPHKISMNVTYNDATGKFYLEAKDWIEYTAGYVMCDIEGKITGNVFSGNLIGNGGTTFRVVRKDND
jgi:hypothetical protein